MKDIQAVERSYTAGSETETRSQQGEDPRPVSQKSAKSVTIKPEEPVSQMEKDSSESDAAKHRDKEDKYSHRGHLTSTPISRQSRVSFNVDMNMG